MNTSIETSTPPNKLTEINLTALKGAIEQDVLVIDVREPGEHAGEHIVGAKLYPLSTFDPAQIPQPYDRSIIVYCQSGRRSAKAAEKLLAAGFTDVAHLPGGLAAWKAAGYPTGKQQNAPISLFRQVQIVAGSLVVLGTLLGAFISPWFLLLSGFVGGGLLFAGITNTCALGALLMKLPYNRRSVGQ